MTRGPIRGVVVAVALLLVGCTPGEPTRDEPGPGRVGEAIVLSQPRAVHRAVPLRDGSVLLVGGCATQGCGGFAQARTSEVVDPRTGTARAGPVTTEPRASGTATLLADGRVLLVGGYPGEGRAPTAGMEVLDPAAGTFAPAGALRVGRADHSATLLPDGRVLVVGGFGAEGEALASVELVDPASGAVTSGPALPEPRAAHAAVAVGDLLVVVGGASRGGAAVPTTHVFDGTSWTDGPRLAVPRVKHAAVALADGRVLVVGGSTTVEGRELLGSTEILTLPSADAVGASAPGPDLAAAQYKLDGAVVALPDGRVVVAGGPRVEVFDPADGSMTTVRETAQPRRSFVTATVVGDRRVLVAGGYDDAITPTTSARVVTVPAR